MDFNTIPDKPFIENLKCSSCENYLSYFPIYLTIDNQNICGRCSIPEGSISVENEVYEVIAKEMEFPCRYMNEGCIERVRPGGMILHEEHCPHRLVTCPASEFNKCNGSICLENLQQHCDDVHSELILKNGEFSLDLLKSFTSKYILIEDHIFLFEMKFEFENNMLNIVMECLNCGLDEYKLSLSNGFKSFTITGSLSDPINTNVNKVCMDSLKVPDNRNLVITGKITVLKNNETSSESKMCRELLQILKCSQCHQYITPPAVQHCVYEEKTICLSCGTDQHYNLIKDYCFNKITEDLNYPCKNQKQGCNFKSPPSFLKKHQLYCQYGLQGCPCEGCKWKGSQKHIITHINQNHSAIRTALYSRFAYSVTPGRIYRIIKFSKYFFWFKFSSHNDCFSWNIQMIGEVINGFKYEIEIIDQSYKGNRLVTRKPCLPYVGINPFENTDQYCCYNRDQVKSLLNNNSKIIFNIRIFK